MKRTVEEKIELCEKNRKVKYGLTVMISDSFIEVIDDKQSRSET